MLVNFQNSEISQLVQPNLKQNKLAKMDYKSKDVNLNSMPNAVYNVAFCAKPNITPSKLERFQGCLLGGAIGDAFGAPIEKMPLQTIRNKFNGKLKYLIKQKDGIADFSDDTQMTLFTIDGLIKAIGKYKEDSINYYKTIFESYRNWYKTQTQQPNESAKGLMAIEGLYKQHEPGYTCMTSIASGKYGTLEEPINNSAGNGGLMRISPVGLLYMKDIQKAFDVGARIAALTHGNPNAYLPAGFMSSLIAELSKGEALPKAIESSKKILNKYADSEPLMYKITLAEKLAETSIAEEQAIEQLGSGWTGTEAMAIAIYSNLKHPNDFKNIVITAANHSGDSDTTAAIAANIAGTIYGIQNIPNQWKKVIYLHDTIDKYAKFLHFITESNKLV